MSTATKTAPKTESAPASLKMPATPTVAAFRLSECEDRLDFLANITKCVDAMQTMPKGMDAEDRVEWRNNAAKAHKCLLRNFPVLEACSDLERFTITVAVIVKDAEKVKNRDRRAVKLSDAVFARLGLHGRTVESVGLA